MSERTAEIAAAELQVPEVRRPRHIAVIMDGNRRWAKERGLPLLKGHEAGAETFKKVAKKSVKTLPRKKENTKSSVLQTLEQWLCELWAGELKIQMDQLITLR